MFSTCTSRIPLFSILMSSFASQLLNKYSHLNAVIFVYKVFSRVHLITNLLSFLPRNDIPQKAFMDRKFFD